MTPARWPAPAMASDGRFRSVADLVAIRGGTRPDAVAVEQDGRILTYGELCDTADRLAGRLRELGVERQGTVALRLDRGTELVIAALAVLRAGATYVPIDPAYPPERQRYVLADCAARVLVTRLPADGVAGTAHVLDVRDTGVRDRAWDGPARPAGPDELAYLIYTSGSTGRPKGVEVTHRGLANLVDWHRRAFTVTGADRAALIAGVGFDASVWELWPYLAAGATVTVPAEPVRRSPWLLRDFLIDERVSVAFAPTALAEALLEFEWPADAPLRVLLTGGDRLHRRPPAGLPFTVVNNYGPTETTVVATSGPVAPGSGDPSLGTPIDGVRVHLLDAAGRPVAAGAVGELYIGGAGVARGYRGRPDLTAERFLPDPFGPPGSRLYRSGDLVRPTGDGGLAFLGRVDAQVQVRGHRVEPGEVEAALAAHAAVRSAAVVAGPDATGAVALTGYAVPRDGSAPTPEQLREHLRDLLPEPMVPARLVVVPELPTTPNGKVDRTALATAPPRVGSSPAARTGTEAAVLAIWRGVLGRSDIGVDDRFEELGGHSLAAVRVAGRIRARLGVDVPLEALFGPVTVADVARAVADARPVGDARAAGPHGGGAGTDGPMPLSPAQQRLWFFDRLVPDSALYNIPIRFTIDGDLDPAALHRALDEIVHRHEALRTRYGERSGQPVQTVAAPGPVPFAAMDLRRAPDQAAALLRAASRAPFDLGTGPLLRALLLRLTDHRHELLVTVHHIAFDAWSVGVFLDELGELYAAFGDGRPPTLPPPPMQYGDVTRWQHRYLPGVLDQRLAYWHARLDPPPPSLELLADHPRPAGRTYRGAKLRHRLPPALAAELGRLARQSGASLFMVMFAAFQVLLHRYTGLADIVTGVPVAGRDDPDTERLIGFFTNTVPLRTDLSDDPSFTELLDRVRRTVLAAFAHADVPLERILADLRPDRDASHNPVFQTLFVMLDAPPAVDTGGVRIRMREELDNGCAKFDLLLFVQPAPEGADPPEGPVLTAEYATDLFEPRTIDRFLTHYARLLHEVVADPGRRVGRLPLPPAVAHGPAVPEAEPVCLHTLVERQAARTPDAVAVEFDGSTMTYAELDRRANRLAHRLRGAGVGPDVPVALYVERSFDLAVGVLGILKAGGAYVPLDPAYPPARLAQILAEVRAPVLVGQRHLTDGLPGTEARIVDLDRDPPGTLTPSGPPATDTRPDNLAYVLFTSGSTGRPKGVAMAHRPIVNLVAWQRTVRGLAGAARTLQFAALGFDVSAQEIFTTWAGGGTLVLLRDEVRRDLPALLAFCASAGIERIFVPFVALQHLAEAAQVSGVVPGRLREVVTAGEQLQITPQIAALFAALPGAALHNHYGPTETHVATAHTLSGDPVDWPRLPPIGTPIANVVVRVLDRYGRPVPVDVPGELSIGGACLARGYLGRPDLTAERFRPDPGSGQRMYRTGDLARLRGDGLVEFLGRADDQVKIRGYRVEPGEVEAAIAGLAGVREVAVVAYEPPGGSPAARRLVAYVVPTTPAPRGEAERLATRYRAALRSVLPEYLVPAAFGFLDALPVTPSGKVDRRALAAYQPPAADVPPAPGTAVPPEDPLERVVALVWGEVLDVAIVARGDDFFALGGHSLVATVAMSRLGEALDVEVPLKVLFANPTVAAFAAVLRARYGDALADAAELFLVVAACSDDEAQAMLRSVRR